MQDLLVLLVLGLLGLGAYWTMVLMPRQRDFQKRQRMARELALGDEIITAGGLIGRVQAIDGDQGTAHVEIADGIVIRMVTAAIIQRYDPDEIASNAQRGLQAEQSKHQPIP